MKNRPLTIINFPPLQKSLINLKRTLQTQQTIVYLSKLSFICKHQKFEGAKDFMSEILSKSETRALTHVYYFSAFSLPEKSMSKYVATNYTYVAVFEQVTWYEALALCSFHGKGFHLASFSTEAEKKEIHSWLRGVNGEDLRMLISFYF